MEDGVARYKKDDLCQGRTAKSYAKPLGLPSLGDAKSRPTSLPRYNPCVLYIHACTSYNMRCTPIPEMHTYV
jgi:hypothetical protein